MSKKDKQIDRIADYMANKLIHGMLIELDEEAKEALQKSPDVSRATEAEACAHILRGLISYHERMTMGNYPEQDFYLDALRFALACVEEKISNAAWTVAAGRKEDYSIEKT